MIDLEGSVVRECLRNKENKECLKVLQPLTQERVPILFYHGLCRPGVVNWPSMKCSRRFEEQLVVSGQKFVAPINMIKKEMWQLLVAYAHSHRSLLLSQKILTTHLSFPIMNIHYYYIIQQIIEYRQIRINKTSPHARFLFWFHVWVKCSKQVSKEQTHWQD